MDKYRPQKKINFKVVNPFEKKKTKNTGYIPKTLR